MKHFDNSVECAQGQVCHDSCSYKRSFCNGNERLLERLTSTKTAETDWCATRNDEHD